ncbi:MAG: MFS transporter [Proteobacteria bacterium]|nr:MFS transporter [Pseudomonadota bacterium]
MPSKRILFFFIAWIGGLLYFAQRWIFGPLIPSLMQEFHTDRTGLGIIGAASLWGYMFTPIIAGLISDRFGRKYTILFGIFGFSALTVICGLVSSIGHLFIGRLLTGMIEPFYFVILLAFTLELFPERPGFFLTAISSGSSLGWFVGPASAGWLLDFTGSWRAPFILTGLAGIVVAVLLILVWPQEGNKTRAGAFFDKSIIKPANLIMLFLLSLTAMFQISAEFGFTMWYPVFLKTEIGTSATIAGLIAGLYGVGQFIGRPFLGWVSDKLGYRRVGISGGILMGTSLVLLLWVSSPFLRAIFTFQMGFIGGAVMGALWTFTGLVFPSFKGLALGVISTFAYAMASAAPISIGYIGDHYSVLAGLLSIPLPCAFLAALAFLATYLLIPQMKR